MDKNKTLNIEEYELLVSIQEEDEGGYVATCPIWDECYAQGETIEETLNELSYVASSLIELYKEENMNIPLRVKSSVKKESKNFTLNMPVITASS